MIQGYRCPDGKDTTPAGYPLLLMGKPLTKTPKLVMQEGVPLKEYSQNYIPGMEVLGQDEIRITCIGSGNPPVRRTLDT